MPELDDPIVKTYVVFSSYYSVYKIRNMIQDKKIFSSDIANENHICYNGLTEKGGHLRQQIPSGYTDRRFARLGFSYGNSRILWAGAAISASKYLKYSLCFLFLRWTYLMLRIIPQNMEMLVFTYSYHT